MFSLEHKKAVYWSDFIFYAVAIAFIATLLAMKAPRDLWPRLTGVAIAGLAGWSLAEYLLHRFILHGLEPFRSWHALHHERPMALIGSPTWFSGGLITAWVFAPGWFFGGLATASALTLGVLLGYVLYALAHHATHHWRPSNPWTMERKRWHALHHRGAGNGCYGVTTSLWDRVFRTTQRPRASNVRSAGSAARIPPGRRDGASDA